MPKVLHFFGFTGVWVIIGQLVMKARERQTLENHQRIKDTGDVKVSYIDYWRARTEAEGARHRMLNVNAFSAENLEGRLAPKNC